MAMSPPQPNMTEYNAPTMPSRKIEWADAIVKWTREPFIDVLMFPGDDCSESLAQIFKGDFIQLSPRHRTKQWCLIRAGHLMGWVNVQDVKFMVHGQQAPPPRETRKPKRALVSRLINFFKK
jgi:hypothetical protein